LRSIDFYEFVGVVVPGAILLIALGVLVDVGPAETLLVPSGLGNTIAYLVLAYVAGHLVGALGNWFEGLYWKLWVASRNWWKFLERIPTLFCTVVNG
jgi:membrane protein DedA with SNARE-associated domain